MIKSVEELTSLLVDELAKHVDNITDATETAYYNENLGDTSFLLAALLQQSLLRLKDSDTSRWFDDCLLTGAHIDNEKLIIDGIMIWARDSNQQRTDPFRFEIDMIGSPPTFGDFVFYFSDSNKPAISYESFSQERHHWYCSGEREWKHVINQRGSPIGND